MRGFPRVVIGFVAVMALAGPTMAQTAPVTVTTSVVAIRGGPVHLKVTLPPDASSPAVPAEILVDGVAVERLEVTSAAGEIRLQGLDLPVGRHDILARTGGAEVAASVLVIPGLLSLLPPLVAIGLALVFKDVLVSLFLGVFSGALILTGGHPLTAVGRTIDQFIAPALADADHAAIIVFSTLLGGMVGVIGRSGGTQGIVDRLSPYATTARRGQVATWLMGVLIFFDDYANTLIVGSTMRPVTDRLRISREKLAYIVDSTAAPVASVIPISTWIGFEVGLIAAAFAQLGLPFNAYSVFVATIPYRFYPIFALVLGFTIAFTCRDMGPMLKAELRASSTGKVLGDDALPLTDYSSAAITPPEGAPRRAFNAFVPIGTVIVVTVAGLYASGMGAVASSPDLSTFKRIQEVFANANPFDALLWASLAGVIVAVGLAVVQRILTIRETMEGMLGGFKSMLPAMVVLMLAWSIGAVCGELHTADYVVGLAQGVIGPHWLPVLVFAMSAVISFATGTSWGTMAILMPLIIPIAHGLSTAAGHDPAGETYYILVLGTISSVLAGSVWGDHCSPISDTTVLSSMASSCDHIAHVRTQLPYALGIGILGMVIGDIPTAFGLSPWISLALGSVVIIVGVLLLGRRSDWRPGRQGVSE